MRVLVINPGATSTKIAVFEEETEILRVSIDHSAEELRGFERVADQMPYRKELILKALREKDFDLGTLDATADGVSTETDLAALGIVGAAEEDTP